MGGDAAPDRRTQLDRVAVELARCQELRHANGPNLIGDGDAPVQIRAGHPDEPVRIQTPGQGVQRLHRPEARTAHDDARRSPRPEEFDGERQVLPTDVAGLPARAPELASRTHATVVVGQHQVAVIGE